MHAVDTCFTCTHIWLGFRVYAAVCISPFSLSTQTSCAVPVLTQIMSFMRFVALEDMPSTFITATDAVAWSRLNWVPEPGTRYAHDFSNAAHVIEANNAPPPPEQLVSLVRCAGVCLC